MTDPLLCSAFAEATRKQAEQQAKPAPDVSFLRAKRAEYEQRIAAAPKVAPVCCSPSWL